MLGCCGYRKKNSPFLIRNHNGSVAHTPPNYWVRGKASRRKSGRSLKLFIHFHLVQRL
jgi:hypothetical protein